MYPLQGVLPLEQQTVFAKVKGGRHSGRARADDQGPLAFRGDTQPPAR